MLRRTAYVLACLIVFSSTSLAGEIGFLEDFALARDRAEALKQLIPGTEDYYYYHCIHHQNTRQFNEVDKVLKLWLKRYGRTARVQEIENRQALLRYDRDPRGSLEFVRQRLGIHFNHQREIMGQKPALPTRLDQRLISRETLTRRALQLHRGTLDGFEDRALGWVIDTRLDPDRRRHLLRRLRRPDYRNLPRLVVEDLNYRHSRGFGSMPIHGNLLLPQLDECVRLKGDLLNQTHFVNTYLTKLWPNPDVDWQHDPKERQAYLDRLWAFVAQLNPSHNSLKAHVLYHRLVHDRAQGIYDKARFMAYIKLPRNVNYINRAYVRRQEVRRYLANLGANFQQFDMLPPVGNDEPLVRSYLMHFFRTEHTYQPYATYINDEYLKHCFAETQIVNGLGDMEQWYSMLPPAKYQALKERVDLDFAPTNKTLFTVDDPVTLDLHVKNVKTLIVKVFEINLLNYYRAKQEEVHTGIDLDGLVANEETVHTYTEPPLRRVKRTFKFPALSKRGAYIIELIGSGRSSRALIRKGSLQFLARTSTAGHVFTVLDEANRKLSDARLWLAGHEYVPEEDGTIGVPFSNKPGRQPVILVHGDFASLDHFNHEREQYALAAGIHVDRESLLKRKKTSVVVRPSLSLNGTPMTLSVLEEPTLVITSTDREGVPTTKEVSDFELHEDRESVYEVQVPDGLAVIQFTLKAKVQNLSQGKKIDLAASRKLDLNGIDRTDKIEALHFSHIDGRYAVDVLGKTGEPRPDRPVSFELKHRDFRDNVNVSLKSDAKGRISLGALAGLAMVRARVEDGPQHTWHPSRDLHTYPAAVHGRAGETIRLPYMGVARKATRPEFSLLENRGRTFVQDRLGALSVKDGFLQIQDLPAGDYDLLLKDSGTHIAVRLTQGKEAEGHVLSRDRHLQVRTSKPLQIESVEAKRDEVRIQLANATKFSRVHVVATRYLPEYPFYDSVDAVDVPSPFVITVPKIESIYLGERDIGDEYRYIIERKYAKKFPGNLLKRPSLLLNPWAVRKTETGVQRAKPGAPPSARAKKRNGGRARLEGAGAGGAAQLIHFANLDFLGQPSAVLLNLRPDPRGVVTVKRSDLGAHQQIHVVAVDPENVAYREVSLPEVETKFDDLRLIAGLDPDQHFAEQKQISVVRKGQEFVLDDITTSTFEAYDTLAKVYALYSTLSSNPTLVEFGFILNWPKLKPEEKREKYSKYACHELSFFLSKKDPEFFKAAVVPHLRNKKDKTFLDGWLLGDDLSNHLKPWSYGQLNVVERILLGQHIGRERPHMARHVKDLFDLIPPNIEHFNHLFKTALKSSALETDDEYGLEGARKEAKREKLGVLRERLVKLGDERQPAKGLALAAARPAATPPAPAEPRARRKLIAALGKKLADKEGAEAEDAFFGQDRARRARVRQLYRKLDKTQEWAENNYYHLPIKQQNADLVTVNAFWNDYAQHDGKGPFFSRNLAEASRSFTEMMLALTVLDLPFTADEHKSEAKGARFSISPGSPMVVFHKEIKEAEQAKGGAPILVSQNFFRHGDRYQHVNNERFDKYVTDEFLVHVVYGCHVVITNPTSARQKLDVLLQIPRGAIPVNNGQYTKGVHVDLQPYRTQTFDYYFYFPAPGKFAHYPVHVAKNEKLVAAAKPFTLNVVEELTKIDRTSWDWISQNGTEADVIAYLRQHNLGRVKLARIAWRMQDRDFFRRATPLLAERHEYDHTLWSYGIKHNELAAAREYLQHCDAFLRRCGDYLDTKLLSIDPIVRKSYQHLEYWPLVNARAHKLGKTRQILNNRFYAQYLALMKVLSYRPELDDEDLMSVTCYLLLQDRVEEALDFFGRVSRRRQDMRLQYDYCTAYLDFFSARPMTARAVAEKYSDYPVDRWRKLFLNVTAQLDEIEGRAAAVVDKDDRDQQQAKLAATEGSFDFKVEAKKITINYQNLDACLVNYYLMDIELLFSRNPFVQQFSGQFSYIRPNQTQTVKLDPEGTILAFDLPQRFHSSNVLVEIRAGGMKKAKAYYSHSLALQVIETYGQLKIAHEDTGKPLPKTYVKAYARMRNGRVRFYKDGYTDLRGRFDYASLSTNELDQVERFSLLVMSEENGAVVREAVPPKR